MTQNAIAGRGKLSGWQGNLAKRPNFALSPPYEHKAPQTALGGQKLPLREIVQALPGVADQLQRQMQARQDGKGGVVDGRGEGMAAEGG
jgi:hypothetical protein